MRDKTPTPAAESDFPVKAGKPACQALIVAGYHQLADLTQASEKELLAIHGVGPKAVRILREALAEKGLAFKE